MHSLGGFAGEPIGDRLTDGNKTAMRKVWRKQRPMWTGGFDLDIKSGKIDLDGDIL